MAKRKRSVLGGMTGSSQQGSGRVFQTGAVGFGASQPSSSFATPSVDSTVDTSWQDAQFGQDQSTITGSAAAGAHELGAETSFNADGNQFIAAPIDWSNPSKLNPFSRAALLVKSYQDGVQGTSNSYAARGQHSSGAYQRAQSANEFGFQQGKSGIDTALTNLVSGTNSGLSQAMIDAKGRWGDPALAFPGTGSSVAATGTQTLQGQGANSVLAQWAGRPTQTGNQKLQGSVKLANGWTLVYVNGKPQFIPPGGK